MSLFTRLGTGLESYLQSVTVGTDKIPPSIDRGVIMENPRSPSSYQIRYHTDQSDNVVWWSCGIALMVIQYHTEMTCNREYQRMSFRNY